MQQLKEIVLFLKRELKSIFGGWDLEKVEIQNSGEFAGKGFSFGHWILLRRREKSKEIFLIKCPFFRSGW